MQVDDGRAGLCRCNGLVSNFVGRDRQMRRHGRGVNGTGYRAGDHWGDDDGPSVVMGGVAARLSSEEIEAVASYIQGLYLDLE